MKPKAGGRSTLLMRIIKGPIRILARARDLYIQSLTAGGGHVSYGNAMGCPTPHIPKPPLSAQSSFNKSAEEELRDLIRLAAARGPVIGAELRRTKSTIPLGGGGAMVAPVVRSRTVGFGRIDEDRAFEFGDDDEDVGLLREVRPIGRNHSVSRRIVVL